MTAIVWFRRDLRLHDHPALAAAHKAATSVYPLFILDPALLTGRWSSPNRAWFLIESLRALDAALRSRGSRLHVRTGDPPSELAGFVAATGATDVYVSRDYAPYGRRRDARVRQHVRDAGVRWHELPGLLAVEPEAIALPGAAFPRTYSQFKKRWDLVPPRDLCPAPLALRPAAHLEPGSLPVLTPSAPSILAPGEAAARERLDRFLAEAVQSYAECRDLPALETATSRLSQDLRFGLLSPTEVIARAREFGETSGKFVSELVWREFYYHLLWHRPQLLRHPLDARFETFPWQRDSALFSAWCAGQTGYPMVDAAMRQLASTGDMHNRLRMVVASFLVKHLRIDWQDGEAHFMRHLVDGDPASNNGGWQWSAGCGTDPQPYFRIFNPILQGKKFDPAGEYVRRWLPELGDVPVEFVHAPWEMPAAVQRAVNCVIGRDYPSPIVDHAEARRRAIEAFSALKSGTGLGRPAISRQ